jgi:hypothetical protein
MVIAVKDPDNLGQVFPEKRLAPGREKEEKIIHMSRNLLNLIYGKLVLPRMNPAEKAVLAVRVTILGNKEYQVDRRRVLLE